jgi:hypothetical protein
MLFATFAFKQALRIQAAAALRTITRRESRCSVGFGTYALRESAWCKPRRGMLASGDSHGDRNGIGVDDVGGAIPRFTSASH